MSNTDDTAKASATEKVAAPEPSHAEPGVTIYDDPPPETKTVKKSAAKKPAKG